jgi:hypothetical protein
LRSIFFYFKGELMLASTRPAARCACGLTIICGLFLNCARAAAQLRVVAVAGQQVPGAPDGTTFTSLSLAGINDPGMTAFIAETQGGQQVMVEHNGAFRTVARQGDEAPDAPAGFAFDAFPFAVLNDAGEVALVGTYSPDGSGYFNGPGYGGPGHALWSESGGSLQPVALRDSMMPGATGPSAGSALFRQFSIPAFNPSGQSAFVSTNDSCDSFFSACYQGAFVKDEIALARLAISGDPAPAVGNEFLFFPFYFDPDFGSDVAIALNDFGETAFVASVDTAASSDLIDVLWMASGGALAPVIQEGMLAPVSPSGPVFDRAPFGAVISMNNSGRVAVIWQLAAGNGVTSSNDSAIWTGDVDELHLVAREGDPAPGASTNFTYLSDPKINAAGDIVFGAVAGEDDDGIWVEREGNLELLARAGQPAPDVPAGAVFDFFYEPTMNSAGEIAFYAPLRVGEGGVTEENNAALWAQDINGILRLIVREGDEFDVDNGPGVDVRVFSDFSIHSSGIFLGGGSGNQDGRPSYFNDRGQLAFWASFTDGGSGVFISDVVAVPEPSARVFLVVASLCVTAIRRPATWGGEV